MYSSETDPHDPARVSTFGLRPIDEIGDLPSECPLMPPIGRSCRVEGINPQYSGQVRRWTWWFGVFLGGLLIAAGIAETVRLVQSGDGGFIFWFGTLVGGGILVLTGTLLLPRRPIPGCVLTTIGCLAGVVPNPLDAGGARAARGPDDRERQAGCGGSGRGHDTQLEVHSCRELRPAENARSSSDRCAAAIRSCRRQRALRSTGSAAVRAAMPMPTGGGAHSPDASVETRRRT
jgi:hypothetical protein